MINFFNVSHFVILFFVFVLTDLTISNKSVKQKIRNIWFAFLTPDIKKFYAQGGGLNTAMCLTVQYMLGTLSKK